MPITAYRAELRDLAARIHKHHRLVETATASAVENAVAAGRLLLKAKTKFGPHGAWREWMDANCHLSQRTAQVYMRLARRLPTAKTQRAAFLSIRAALAATAAATARAKARVIEYQAVDTTPRPVVVEYQVVEPKPAVIPLPLRQAAAPDAPPPRRDTSPAPREWQKPVDDGDAARCLACDEKSATIVALEHRIKVLTDEVNELRRRLGLACRCDAGG